MDTFLRCYVIRIVGSSSSRPPLPRVCGYLHRLDSRPGRAAELHTGTGQNISQILPLLIFIYVFQETPNTQCDKVFRLRGPASRGRPDPRIINVETRTNCANNSANNSCLRNWLPIASCPSARYNLLGIGQASMQPSWTK